jgi:hypothetical protein
MKTILLLGSMFVWSPSWDTALRHEIAGPPIQVHREDPRSFAKRLFLSTRPWFEAAKGTNLTYHWMDEEHSIDLDGTVGVGLAWKVDF